MLLEEELTFNKNYPSVNLQKASDSYVSNGKRNSATVAEIATILCEVITLKITRYCKENRFASLSGDAFEAIKKTKTKQKQKKNCRSMELVFLKLLAQECGDYVPTFLLKSQHLKDLKETQQMRVFAPC